MFLRIFYKRNSSADGLLRALVLVHQPVQVIQEFVGLHELPHIIERISKEKLSLAGLVSLPVEGFDAAPYPSDGILEHFLRLGIDQDENSAEPCDKIVPAKHCAGSTPCLSTRSRGMAE